MYLKITLVLFFVLRPALLALLQIDLDILVDRGPPRDESRVRKHFVSTNVPSVKMLKDAVTARRRHQGPVVEDDDSVAL